MMTQFLRTRSIVSSTVNNNTIITTNVRFTTSTSTITTITARPSSILSRCLSTTTAIPSIPVQGSIEGRRCHYHHHHNHHPMRLSSSSTSIVPYRRFTNTAWNSQAAENLALATTASSSSSSSSSDDKPVSSSSMKSSKSNSSKILPSRHSVHLPPAVCTDGMELQELTTNLLHLHDVDNGEHHPNNSIINNNVLQAYRYNDDRRVLDRYRQTILYTIRGHSSMIPNTLYSTTTTTEQQQEEENNNNNNDIDDDTIISSSLRSIVDILTVVEEQDDIQAELYQRKLLLRQQQQTTSFSSSSSLSYGNNTNNDVDVDDEMVEIGESTFGEVDDMFSSIVEQHKHEHDHTIDSGSSSVAKSELDSLDDAMSKFQDVLNHVNEDDDEFDGPTTNQNIIPTVMTADMYETLLDALAGASQTMVHNSRNNENSTTSYSNHEMLTPTAIYEIVSLIVDKSTTTMAAANDDGDQNLPTIVTYNAALRTVANLCRYHSSSSSSSSNMLPPQFRDEALQSAFGTYNMLTHNPFFIRRNSQSIQYLLQIIQYTIPPSRVRGNMSVTLWDQASREGIVTPSLVRCILENIHGVKDWSNMVTQEEEEQEGMDNNKDIIQTVESINGPEFGKLIERLISTLTLRRSSSSTKTRKKDNSDILDRTYVISPARFARSTKKYSHHHPSRLY